MCIPVCIHMYRNSRGICQVLVEHGADIHQANSDGATPFSLAESQELKQNMMGMLYLLCEGV